MFITNPHKSIYAYDNNEADKNQNNEENIMNENDLDKIR